MLPTLAKVGIGSHQNSHRKKGNASLVCCNPPLIAKVPLSGPHVRSIIHARTGNSLLQKKPENATQK